MDFDLVETLLSFQSGLLGYVSPRLRAVTVDFLEKKRILDFHFYYDGKITHEMFDLASSSTTEVNPGLEAGTYICNANIVTRVDYPNKLPITGRLVYLRKEPNCGQYIQKKCEFPDDYPTMAKLLLYIQQATLGKVKQNLRKLSIENDETTKTITFYFLYDGFISEEDRSLADEIINEACDPFKSYRVVKHLKRVDFPHRPPLYGSRAAYSRYEDISKYAD